MPFDETLRSAGERLARLQLGSLGAASALPMLAGRRIRAIRTFFGA